MFGGANRKKSEQDGLKVYLHHFSCHIFGKKSAHKNAEIMRALRAEAQRIAMKHYGWTVEQFIERYGKNYL